MIHKQINKIHNPILKSFLIEASKTPELSADFVTILNNVAFAIQKTTKVAKA